MKTTKTAAKPVYSTQKKVTQLSYEITGLAIKVHKALGPGLLESVYEKCLKHELIKNGYDVKQQVKVPVIYDTIDIEADLRLDLLVNDTVIVELKAIECILPIHEAQLMTYMKLLEKPQGLLINFNVVNISSTMKPFVNEFFRGLPEM
ncbi:GxxExxY protein [Salinivirga cyanobacteriivorans]|uniref:GxxExxY protein n=1 Tax=Salinivirga cyanobacteriivorans TaxID=1307839 RepID=A0A0S2HZY2_9BACT|nr:GxxExxY protein [Salinivirga cyanobacteriivorans]ALO15582.1 GxxExxY protein [Salinivirga cyanobacteriivorans]